jgi:hypothetical protein
MDRDFFFDGSSESEGDFLTKNKGLICKLIIEAVKESMEKNLKNFTVFRIINPNKNFVVTSQITKDDWLESLEKCLEYYISIEDYETCGEIKKLILKVKDGNTKTD